MRLKDYIKDRLSAYAIFALTFVLMLIFMSIFHVTAQCIIIVFALLLAGTVSAEVYNFTRKNRWYSKLLCDLEQLDKKYLITEMSAEPDFLDGRILYDVMSQTDKSMCDNVSAHRREASDFREYIEMWVHEIKLPVASLQLMSHNDGNTRYCEQLKRIDEYIENVLYYARSGNAEKDYIIKPVSLKRVFAETAVKNREELQGRNIGLHTDSLDKEVMTDSKWLAFIIGQLMGNSMKYKSTEITVFAEETDDHISLHFRDNGIGIPEKDISHIFDKSFTGENGRTHSKSTGMGLYIVKKLCDKLGHTVSAESVRGEYTDIIIAFGKNDMHSVL